MQTNLHVVRLLIAITTIITTAPAFASDGQLEINQACAVNTGCFPGDAAGFPVTVPAPGSYLLTGNLATGSSAVTAIEVAANDVTVDLNGFTISCAPAIGAAPRECNGSGDGYGVIWDRSGRLNTTVRNGTVTGMGQWGVGVHLFGRVENITARNNGGFGIFGFNASVIVGNIAVDNGNSGISINAGGIVKDNLSVGNANAGIQVQDSGAATISGNSAYANDSLGLIITTGGENPATSGYRGNVFTENNGGPFFIQVFGGVDAGQNICGTNTTCP